MALVVEDGTGKVDAESYISAADASAYHAARGSAAWAALASDAVREQLLRKGTEYMESAYGERWQGCRMTGTQALSWPRSGVVVHGYSVASDVVPQAVQRACAELALRAISGDLSPDLSAQVKQETVGQISVTYADGARQQVKFQAVDGLLSGLLCGPASAIKVVRA